MTASWPLCQHLLQRSPGDIYSKVSKRADAVVIERMAMDSTFIDPRLKTSRLPYEWSSTALLPSVLMTIYGAGLSAAARSLKRWRQEGFALDSPSTR